jgi:hypothetical protein
MTRFDTVVKPNRPRLLNPIPRRSADEVRAMLREIAYVLHVTRKVKAEILAEREDCESRMHPPAASVA